MPGIQTCFVIEARYVADAANKRQPFRDQHIERLTKLSEEGALIMAGAFEDLSASVLVVAVETQDAAEAIVKTDIYMKEGVWTGYTIRKLNKLEFNG